MLNSELISVESDLDEVSHDSRDSGIKQTDIYGPVTWGGLSH